MEFKDLLVLQEEGYDGQFYYFISRYLYDKEIQDLTLDSTSFRMLRIGSSLLYGLIPALLGWEFYTYWVLFLHHILFLSSYFLFYKMLDDDIKYLSLIYLFNPYVIISNMLLIGDTIFISLFMFFIFAMNKIDFEFSYNSKTKINLYYFIALLLAIFIALTKEVFLFFLIPLGFLCVLKKDKYGLILITVPIVVLIFWYLLILYYFNFKEVNPISHSERIRIPFLAMFVFYRNLIFSINSIIHVFKSIPYLIILFLYISLLLQGFNIIKNSLLKKGYLNLLIDVISLFPIGMVILIIAIVDIEYWLAFDNIFRIFSLAFIWLLFINLKDKTYTLYSFYSFNLIITLLLIFRYSIFKKIGLYRIL